MRVQATSVMRVGLVMFHGLCLHSPRKGIGNFNTACDGGSRNHLAAT